MINELEYYIKSYFGVANAEDIQKISSLFKLVTFKKGDFFLEKSRQSKALCFVQSGVLRVFTTTEKKDITQWIAQKGYFVADLPSFVFESPSRWTIQALVDTEIYSISDVDYNKLETLIPKWNHLEKLFIVRCFSMMEDRIFSHLSMTAEERYYLFFENNKILFNQIPLQYIASVLGMTPETLSRIRKKALIS